MAKKDEDRTQAVSLWDTLPNDVKVYILKLLDMATLQSLQQTRKLEGKLASQVIDNFLRTVPAPTLLRELPVYVPKPGRESEGDDGLPARSDVLKFQNLARRFNHQTRWQGFTTMEAGVLALMTVPLNQLEPIAVRRLAFNEDSYFESEFVEAELKKLSPTRVKEFIDQIVAHHQITDELKTGYLKAFAVMVLSATDDFFVQDCIVAIYCVTDENFRDPLLNLFQYADKNNHRRILEILAWITAIEIDKLGETLRDPNYRGIQVMTKLLYLIAQPGSFVQGEAFTDNYHCMHSVVYNPLIATNYTFWSLACLYHSWEKAMIAHNTVVSHALILLKMWNVEPAAMAELDKYFRHFIQPAFVNLSEIFLRPSIELWRLNSGTSSQICSNFQGVKFVEWTSETSNGMWNLSISRSMMNNVEFVNQYVFGVSFEKMNIHDFNCRGAQFIRCKFNYINLKGTSSFERAEFCSSVLRDCRFSASVNFQGCHFTRTPPNLVVEGESQEGSPVLFDRCLFENTDFSGVSGVADCRLINCQFKNGTKLPEGIRCYETSNKDIDSIEGAYELFKLLEASQDIEMIKYVVFTLKNSLAFLDRLNTTFTIEQAVMVRLIFRNDPSALEVFEKCHYKLTDFTTSAYALLKRLDPIEHAEMLKCFYDEVLYIASNSSFENFCTLDEEMLCHEITRSDPTTFQKYKAMNIRAFDTIEGAYYLFKELRSAGDDNKIRYLQAQLLSTISALPKKAILTIQDKQCREIFGYQFSRGMSFINTVTRGLVATPHALQEYEKLNVQITWEGYVNKHFRNFH